MQMQTEQNPNFLVIVDVQPGYLQECHLLMDDIVNKINNTDQEIILFYVGKSCNLDTKNDVIAFLLENGVDEYKVDQIQFIEKDYGFFRGWMDNNVPDKIIIDTISYMEKTKIHDTKKFTNEDWKAILKTDVFNHDIIFDEEFLFPTFYQKPLKNPTMTHVELIGGGRYECLEEINLYLKALGKTTTVTEKLCYGGFKSAIDYNNKSVKKSKRKSW